MLFEQHPEVASAGAVTEPVGLLVGRDRSGQIAPFFVQDCEVERAVGVAALSCSPEGRLGGCHLATLSEQRTEVASGEAVTELVGLPVGRHRPPLIATLFEHERLPERPIGVVGLSEIGDGDCCRVGGCGRVGIGGDLCQPGRYANR